MKQSVLLAPFLVVGALILSATPAQAREPYNLGVSDDFDHFEVTMGFVVGQRSHLETPFKLETNTSLEGVSGLVDFLGEAPFDQSEVYGLRYDARLVVSYLRMTVGLDIPFASYNPTEATGLYELDGVERRITVQSLDHLDLRFGIGAEVPLGPVSPFVDVLGAVHWSWAAVAIDDQVVHYAATTFAYSARAGLRLHVRDWFFASMAGEVGLAGDVLWGAELSLGFAIY